MSLPGFNGTPRPAWISSITDITHFAQELVAALGLDQYVLMGASMGGWVAAEMAAMDRHQIKGLVLIDAVASTIPLSLAEQLLVFETLPILERSTVLNGLLRSRLGIRRFPSWPPRFSLN